ncbi:hypothetical protein TSOC_003393 [Tetrabaena socialis]|uniref:Uncharacterized protein n=1 Tax=Tetrabaena socialis TaxID=47790 RepID=A0A2J8ABT0_9CHLO|nr:hypothetical protein TSOC_003393 [Tetrabaena socialis]|eukprot:PNH09933.1 hypothetical protein TSOC_003393 [Tetrabaena socialis]
MASSFLPNITVEEVASRLNTARHDGATNFIVTNTWAVCLIGMMVVLLGAAIVVAGICCQCFFDSQGFCRDKCSCCSCCSGSSRVEKAAKPSATDGKVRSMVAVCCPAARSVHDSLNEEQASRRSGASFLVVAQQVARLVLEA